MIKNKLKKVDISVILLFLIVFLGLILRLVGIKHGFPFIFHPDEPTIIRSALGIRFDPNPKHFDWPHLYIYLNYFLYMGFAKIRDILGAIGLKESVSSLFPLFWNDDLIYYYLTRCFSAILGALTAIPVYLAGKNLFGKRVGVFSALAITLMPYHVWHSHYALGDVPMTFFSAWGFYFSTLIITRFKIKDYIFSGLFIGFSASVKYNGGLTALMVPLAHFLRPVIERKEEKKKKCGVLKDALGFKGLFFLLASGISALFGFLIGTPYAILDFKTFSRDDGPQGAFWQFKNVGSVGLTDHAIKFFTESFNRLLNDTGYLVVPVFFLGLMYLIYQVVRNKVNREVVHLEFIYLVSLFLIWYFSGFRNNRSHYYFVVYPFLAVIFGFIVASFRIFLRNFLSKYCEKFISARFRAVMTFLFVGLMFTPMFYESVANSYSYFRGDTRNILYEWLMLNTSPEEEIVYNDKSLNVIFQKVGVRGKRDLSSFDESKNSTVVLYDPGVDEESFIEENESYLNEVLKISSKFRLGSDIEVYGRGPSPGLSPEEE